MRSALGSRSTLLLALTLLLIVHPSVQQRSAPYAAWDDFEDQALHATLLIDPQGRERWAHVGATPFSDVERLLDELRCWSSDSASATAAAPAPPAGTGGN